MELSTMTKVRAKKAGWSDELIERIEASEATDTQVENLARGELGEEKINGWLDFLENHPDNPFGKAPFNIFNSPGGGRREGHAGSGRSAAARYQHRQLRDRAGHVGPAQRRAARDRDDRSDHGGGLLDSSTRPRSGRRTQSTCMRTRSRRAGLRRPSSTGRTVWRSYRRSLSGRSGRCARSTRTTVWSSRRSSGVGWKEISYGFHEVKLFLATQTFDAGRKVEVLRKRALINGGGAGSGAAGSDLSRLVPGADLHRHDHRAGRGLQELRGGAVRVGVGVGAGPRLSATSSPRSRRTRGDISITASATSSGTRGSSRNQSVG